jgi:carboxylesterase
MASNGAKAEVQRAAALVAGTVDRHGLIGTGSPEAIRVEGGAPGVLAFHGYGGTPLEVELVSDVARELGLRALAPLLPGHGTRTSELARCRFDDWAQAAEEAHREIDVATMPPVVAGLSMGSLLAIHLAATRGNRVRALILIANAVRLTPATSFGLRLMRYLPKRIDFAVPKVTSDIADPAARRRHLTYGEQPVRAALEVLDGGRRAEALLPHVTCPTLILHGVRDRVCPVGNAAIVEARLGSASKRVVLFPRSRHILTRDCERRAVRREIRDFVASLAHSVPVEP